MKHVLKPLVFLLAAIYFLVDAVFLTIARPIARRLANLWIFDRLRLLLCCRVRNLDFVRHAQAMGASRNRDSQRLVVQGPAACIREY